MMILLLAALFGGGEYCPDILVHQLANGQRIYIQPEEPILEPIYRTETKTRYVSTCGMPCSVHVRAINETVRVRVGEEPMNAPTPLPALESILRLAGVRSNDILADLGCGDGRVCITASALLGSKTIGLDKRHTAIAQAGNNARTNGVQLLARFTESKLDWRDFEQATVVYCYLTPETMAQLRIPTTVRMGISYKHAWPGVKCEQIGEFYVWKRSATVANTRPQSAAICAGGS